MLPTILLLFGDDILLLIVGEYDDELGRLLLLLFGEEDCCCSNSNMDCRYRELLQWLKFFPPYYDHDPSRIVLVMSLCRMMMDCALGWYIGRISQAEEMVLVCVSPRVEGLREIQYNTKILEVCPVPLPDEKRDSGCPEDGTGGIPGWFGIQV